MKKVCKDGEVSLCKIEVSDTVIYILWYICYKEKLSNWFSSYLEKDVPLAYD